MVVMTEPKYLMRLDLTNNADPVEERRHVSYHLQADYANLKNMQNELQKAVDEFKNVHSQRINRYIS